MQKIVETAVGAYPKQGVIDPPYFKRLHDLVVAMNPLDYGLHKQSPFWKTYSKNRFVSMVPMRYHTNFHITCFVVPKGGCLPLHDHPDMTVLSKLLYGKIRYRSFDWEERRMEKDKHIGQITKARLVADFILTDAKEEDIFSVRTVHPDKANVHTISALEDSAFFDILAPPYDPPHRSCHFYTEQTPAVSIGDIASLKEIDCPMF